MKNTFIYTSVSYYTNGYIHTATEKMKTDCDYTQFKNEIWAWNWEGQLLKSLPPYGNVIGRDYFITNEQNMINQKISG